MKSTSFGCEVPRKSPEEIEEDNEIEAELGLKAQLKDPVFVLFYQLDKTDARVDGFVKYDQWVAAKKLEDPNAD